jgi:hypothetical protein
MPFFSLDLLPLTYFRALKHPIPAMREDFPFPRSFLLARPRGAIASSIQASFYGLVSAPVPA